MMKMENNSKNKRNLNQSQSLKKKINKKKMKKMQ